MTQEQQAKLEQLANEFAPISKEYYDSNSGFIAGAKAVLDNPQEWGLVYLKDLDRKCTRRLEL